MSSDTDTDGGYVHAPGSDGTEPDVDEEEPDVDERKSDPDGTEPNPDGFGRRGWVLTGVLLMCVLVIPGVIYAYPYAAGSFGLTFFGTYLVLPLIPALLLGLVAVWSMTAATADE